MGSDMFSFRIVHQIARPAAARVGPRAGQLTVNGHAIDTPNFLAHTSRGVVPHLTPDSIEKHAPSLAGAYVALEDFIEKAPFETPALYAHPSKSLREFTSFPPSIPLLVGARRFPQLSPPAHNSDDQISIVTSVGFRHLKWNEYADAVFKHTNPDIALAMPDLPPLYRDQGSFGKTRTAKMTLRTELWLKSLLERRKGGGRRTPIFAAMLPLEPEQMTAYLEYLTETEEDNAGTIGGLTFYDTDITEELETATNGLLSTKPRLALDERISNPHALLRAISRGLDLFVLPFLNDATDAGIALDFHFPPTLASDEPRKPLGVDMWDAVHATDLRPLSDACTCYACTRHHRAYVQHLLSAKEMLAWVLLQLHNVHVLAGFFAGVRSALADGTFDHAAERFSAAYEAALPDKTGAGPRARGYTFRSEAKGEKKRNGPAWRKDMGVGVGERSSGVRAKSSKDAKAQDEDEEEEDLGVQHLMERSMSETTTTKN